MPQSADSKPALNATLRAFITGPVAINVASHDRALLPSIARAYGCKLCADGKRIAVFLSARSAAAVLGDLRTGAPIAVVFCLPSTHATLQFKSPSARLLPLAPGDREIMLAYARAFHAEIVGVGYDDPFTASLVAPAADEAVAVEFTPTAVFDQTPGPEAGKPLEIAA